MADSFKIAVNFFINDCSKEILYFKSTVAVQIVWCTLYSQQNAPLNTRSYSEHSVTKVSNFYKNSLKLMGGAGNATVELSTIAIALNYLSKAITDVKHTE